MRVGSLVECINNNGDCAFWVRPGINTIYTVRHFYISPTSKTPAIYLEEIVNSIHLVYGIERGYRASRFREVLPPIKIDIEEILETELTA